MTFDEYQAIANATSGMRDKRDIDTRILGGPSFGDFVNFVRVDHGAAGCASEAGEIAEHVKHVRFHGTALDREHLIKEAGDALWYLAELAIGLGTTLEKIAERNVEKLKRRYPEGHFTVERSENRNT